jgi:predicted regulator of Ras-like GTPase activity (Roadblock/LC7/MglB family)
MISALEPLAELPGVDLVMLVTHDGVPIATVGGSPEVIEDEQDAGAPGGMGREEALAALAVGWHNELAQATAPLTWDSPSRIVMRCARGSIVVRHARGAILLLLLKRGASPEDVRLPMDGTVARIERSLRGMGGNGGPSQNNNPPGPMPSSGSPRSVDGSAGTNKNTQTRGELSGN